MLITLTIIAAAFMLGCSSSGCRGGSQPPATQLQNTFTLPPDATPPPMPTPAAITSPPPVDAYVGASVGAAPSRPLPNNDKPQTLTPASSPTLHINRATISAGGASGYAIDISGNLWAWGWNQYGQLGIGNTTNQHAPVSPIQMNNTLNVSSGDSHVMAIMDGGGLWAWGNNNYGQLGDGTTGTRHAPHNIVSDHIIVNISAGYSHSMAITSGGDLYAWGSNAAGQIGDGTTINRLSPTMVKQRVIAAAAGCSQLGSGNGHSMAICDNGDLWTWGYNHYGQLGDDSFINRPNPTRIMQNVMIIAAGCDHSMAITHDGTLYAWGNNLGPIPARLMDNTKTIATGCSHSFAITNAGRLYGWPNDQFDISPIHITDNVSTIAAGFSHAIAVTHNGDLYTWGAGGAGRLGHGATTDHDTPMHILPNILLPFDCC